MPSSRKICQQNTVNCWSNSAVRPRLWMEWTDNVWDRGRTSEDVFIRYTVSPFPSTDAALPTEFIQLLVFFLLKIPASAVSCFLENLLVVSSVWQSAFKNYVFLKETNRNGSIVQSFVQFHAHVFLFSCNHIQITRPTLNKIAYCSFRRVETKQDRRGLQRNYALNCSSIIFGNRRQNDLCLKNANCFVPEAESLVEAQLVDE